MTSKKRELEARQWAKCQQVGTLPLEDILRHQLTRVDDEDWIKYNENIRALYNLLPHNIQKEINAEKRDYMIYKPVYSPFNDTWYRQLVGVDPYNLYCKIVEKLKKIGFRDKNE